MPNVKGLEECRYDRRNWSRLANATEGMLVSMRSRNDGPSLEQWAEQIECAKALNANIVTGLHSFGIPDNAEINGCDFSEKIVKMANDNGVKLSLETGELAKLERLGEEFGSLGFCLDTGYANLDPVIDFKQYVDKLAERVSHLHLTDNYGQTDDHEPPGLRGGITRENWDYLLKALSKYDNEITGSLEMNPCMPEVMVRQASEFLFDELKWPNQPQQQPNYKNAPYRPS